LGYRRVQVLRPGDDVALVLDGREVARIAVADLLPEQDDSSEQDG
jgi:hypothetical protein